VEKPPVFFNETAWKLAVQRDSKGQLQGLERRFTESHAQGEAAIQRWLVARRSGNAAAEASARQSALAAGDGG